ncbi:MAG: replicative DNA helicase [Thioalkalivibrionaceae bacterium]
MDGLLRTPPYALEAEQAVIGGLLLDNEAWDRIADRVSAEDFYRQDHRRVIRAIAQLVERGQPFDLVTVSETLAVAGGEGGIDLAYLADLVSATPSAANIVAYAGIVRERSILRQLIQVGTEIAEAGFQPEGRSSRELLDMSEQKVFAIAEQGMRGQQGFRSMRPLLGGVVNQIEQLFESKSSITGLATGYTDLDRETSGLHPGDLVIVAGRPSMGKTSFAMNIAEHVAMRQRETQSPKPVAVFSMEMPAEQLTMRLISSLGRIHQGSLRTGQLQERDWAKLGSAVELLSQAPIFIDDTPALSPNELRARTRRLFREHKGLALIVVDYLQLMQTGSGRGENRATEISEISRSLKALAKEMGVPMIALSQLNRSLEQRPNKRPVMSDLRESGAIEQDADLILFVYRDEVYNAETTDKGTAEIIIAKQRNGPIGTVRLAFRGEYTRFDSYVPDVQGHPVGAANAF